MTRTELERRANQWNRHHLLRALWLGGSAGFAAASIVVRTSPAGAVGFGAAVGAVGFYFFRRRSPTVTVETVAAHLNRLCPTLEESATLWLRDASTLALVERLQLRRLNVAWESLPNRTAIGCPHRNAHLLPLAFCITLLVALTVAAVYPSGMAPSARQIGSPAVPGTTRAPVRAPALRTAALTIQPPAYLGASIRRVAGLDTEVPEGSIVSWDIETDGDLSTLSLRGATEAEHLPAENTGPGRFRARTTILTTRVYQLAVTSPDGSRTVWPQVHAIKAARDLPPRISWQEPSAVRTLVDPANGHPLFAVRLSATDDYGVAQVKLVLTVAKGSGEGVKFREQELGLDRLPDSAPGDMFGRSLDLLGLGLEPGDELYFHAVATDRRAPTPNLSRSETRFIVLRGPATELAAPGLAIAGVNRVPQYFRSQRQLIIDTEQLLAARASLTEAKFRERSEDIGVDQKLLRLRYGQFLGEEFEPTSGGAPKEAQAMAAAGALRSQPREAASRAAAVERAIEAQHVHPTSPERDGRPVTVAELMAPFLHNHDNAEAATLFDAQVKASLRAVLAAMWEAEGHLRTGQPEAALPAENRALDLLKALQAADRAYVKRIGYEPAPIKETERRLQGELDAIPKRTQENLPSPAPDPVRNALREALGTLGETAGRGLTGESARLVDARLVAAAQDQPEKYLSQLELWRRPASAITPTERADLRKALWSLLPAATENPHRPLETAPVLARDYFEALGAGGGSSR